MEVVLRFGIPQLDEILHVHELHKPSNKNTDAQPLSTSSSTILGPDGTGKSVFALHIASTYLSDAIRKICQNTAPDKIDEHLRGIKESQLPHVLYVSTDLSHERAATVWKNFWLDFPWNRHVPFDFSWEIDFKREHQDHPVQLELVRIRPQMVDVASGPDLTLKSFFRPSTVEPSIPGKAFRVGFLDLASLTAGDDWNLLFRIVAAVPRQSNVQQPNLLIVDPLPALKLC